MAKEALNALKSTTNAAVMLGIWTFQLVMGVEVSIIYQHEDYFF